LVVVHQVVQELVLVVVVAVQVALLKTTSQPQ
jgi:hypothetical protein